MRKWRAEEEKKKEKKKKEKSARDGLEFLDFQPEKKKSQANFICNLQSGGRKKSIFLNEVKTTTTPS